MNFESMIENASAGQNALFASLSLPAGAMTLDSQQGFTPATTSEGIAAQSMQVGGALMESERSRYDDAPNNAVLSAVGSALSSLGHNPQRWSTMNAGIDVQRHSKVVRDIIIKPYPAGWHRFFVDGVSLFICRAEDFSRTRGNYTAADVPTLNEFFYRAEQAKKLAAAAGAAGASQIMPDYDVGVDRTHVWATSPAEFIERWNYYGQVHSNDTDYRLSSGTSRYQAVVGVSMRNDAWAYNLFAPNLQRGDRLFYVAGHFDNMPYCANVDNAESDAANFYYGQMAADKQSRFMVRGYSDRLLGNSAGPMPYTQFERMGKDWNKLDLTYKQKEEQFKIIYADGERNSRAENAVYDAMMTMHVMYVGQVKSTKGASPSIDQLIYAHQSQRAMLNLQRVELNQGM